MKAKSESIRQLPDAIRERFGERSIRPWAEYDDPTTAGFTVDGIGATFSVLTPTH